MAYVDTNVFVYPLIYAQTLEETKLATKILHKIAEGGISAQTSSLTWDELVWTVRRFKGAETAQLEGRRLLHFPNLKLLSVDGVLQLAQVLLEKYNLGPRDAIHIACALKNGITEIISDDKEFDKVKEIKRIGLPTAASG